MGVSHNGKKAFRSNKWLNIFKINTRQDAGPENRFKKTRCGCFGDPIFEV